MFSKTEFHVLILGIDKAGKTVMHFHIFCDLSCFVDSIGGFILFKYIFGIISCNS